MWALCFHSGRCAFSKLVFCPSSKLCVSGLTAAVAGRWPEQGNRRVSPQIPQRQLGLNQVWAYPCQIKTLRVGQAPQHAGAGMSDTIRSGTNGPSGRVDSQKYKDKQTLMSIQKNGKLLSGFHWPFPLKQLPCKWEKLVFSENESTYTWFRNCLVPSLMLRHTRNTTSVAAVLFLSGCSCVNGTLFCRAVFFFSFLLNGQKMWQLVARWDWSDSSLRSYHKDRLSHWIHMITTERRAGWKYSAS